MRCLALAQRWQLKNGAVFFVSAEITPTLGDRLKAESMQTAVINAATGSIEDAEQTLAHASACGASWIVVDGYVFGAAWQKRIKDSGLHLLVIDDYGHSEYYHADIILNQNASALESIYSNRDTTTQDLEPVFHDAGQFYWFRVEALRRYGQLLTASTCDLELSSSEVQDIDHEVDWQLAELKRKRLDT
jgi:hypothetical protein